MPSLYQTPPPPPILGERILKTIRDPLWRRHGGVPSWYPEIDAVVARLVHLGMKVSAYPSAPELTGKLRALADAVPPLEAIGVIIHTQLVRSARQSTIERCDKGHLSLFIALVDAWLRACEQHVRQYPRRFHKDISAFEDAYKDIELATPPTVSKPSTFESLLQLFDNLGLTKSSNLDESKDRHWQDDHSGLSCHGDDDTVVVI